MSKNNKTNLIYNLTLVFLSIAIALAVLLSSSLIQEKYKLSIGSPSPKRFMAPREIVNQIATDKLKEQYMQSVSPVVYIDSTVQDKVIDKITNFFSEIDIIRINANPISTPDEEITPVKRIIDPSAFSLKMTENQINSLIDRSDKSYSSFKDDVIDAITNMMIEGVSEDTGKAINHLRQKLELSGWDLESINLTNAIALSVLEQNEYIDQEATEKARQEKAEGAKPIVFRLGEKIIDEGELISEEVYTVLLELGFMESGLTQLIVPVIGATAVVTLLYIGFIAYIAIFNKSIMQNKKEALLLCVLFTTIIVISRFMTALPFQMIPIVLFTMLISILLDTRLAIFQNIVVTILCFFVLNADVTFLMYYLTVGLISACLGKVTTERNKIFTVGLVVGLSCAFTMMAIDIFINKTITNKAVNDSIFALLSGILSVILCIGSLPIWEYIFGIVTPIKLLDLINPDKKILQRVIIEAPGTYHHSLIVANLAETAAYDVGANPILARVGAYYHDIGKIEHPNYFVENQVGTNLHDSLEPKVSVEIIINHIKDGIAIAKKNKLPKSICDIIEEHHGTTMIKYFYYKAVNDKSAEEVDEKDFRYNYKIPSCRESAIVMLADTVEAAVRSMVSSCKTLEEVNIFVRALIKDKLDDGQLVDSDLKIMDLETIACSFMRVFKGMYHERVTYPAAMTKDIKKIVVKKDSKIDTETESDTKTDMEIE